MPRFNYYFRIRCTDPRGWKWEQAVEAICPPISNLKALEAVRAKISEGMSKKEFIQVEILTWKRFDDHIPETPSRPDDLFMSDREVNYRRMVQSKENDVDVQVVAADPPPAVVQLVVSNPSTSSPEKPDPDADSIEASLTEEYYSQPKSDELESGGRQRMRSSKPHVEKE